MLSVLVWSGRNMIMSHGRIVHVEGIHMWQLPSLLPKGRGGWGRGGPHSHHDFFATLNAVHCVDKWPPVST